MGTFLKIYNENTNLEVGLIDDYISIATDSNEPDSMVYNEVKLTKSEVCELIEFLQKRKDELE